MSSVVGVLFTPAQCILAYKHLLQLHQRSPRWLKNSRLGRPHKNKSHRHVTHVCTCAFLLLSLYTFYTHIFFLDHFIKNNLTLPINKHCADPQNEECGRMVKTTSSIRSGHPCHRHVGPCRTFSLTVHHSTKHHLDSTIFSKITLHILHNSYTMIFSENAQAHPAQLQTITRSERIATSPLCDNEIQSGRTLRTTHSTGYEPKYATDEFEPNELATKEFMTTSRSFLEDPYQPHDVQRENLENKINKPRLLKK